MTCSCMVLTLSKTWSLTMACPPLNHYGKEHRSACREDFQDHGFGGGGCRPWFGTLCVGTTQIQAIML